MSDKVYEDAFNAAVQELEGLKEQERQITIRKAQLRQTVDALIPLVCGEQTDINKLSLPNAMRLIVRSAGRPLTANDLKTKLEDIGFEVSKFENPLANITTAMNRMVENDEMMWVEDEGKKKAIPTPDLKPVPLPEIDFSVLAELLPLKGLGGLNSGSDKDGKK